MNSRAVSLIFRWAELMALTLALALAGDVIGVARPGPLWLTIIGAVAAFKARIVLRSYLGLIHAPGALAGFFSVAFALLALVVGSFLIFPTPSRPFDQAAVGQKEFKVLNLVSSNNLRQNFHKKTGSTFSNPVLAQHANAAVPPIFTGATE